MSKGWHTKADVLKDLSEVNGRRTGAEHLDQHVVTGERPPPIVHEVPDVDEISYFYGGVGPLAGIAEPDLGGISVMLKMVNGLDDTVDNHEPMTIYRNKVTDEIRISKLNPFAGEYVPGASKCNNRNVSNHNSPKKSNHNSPKKSNHNSPNKSNMFEYKSDRTLDKSVEMALKDVINGTETNVLPKYSMFKSKSDKLAESNVNENKETSVLGNKTPNVNENAQGKPVSQNRPDVSQKEPVNSLSNPNTVNGLTKRKIEKSIATDDSCNKSTNPDIKEIQEKIKSTLIASSSDNSLKTKRQKNVAIATLLKMGMIAQNPVKLMTPEHFENPPSKEQKIENSVNDEVPRNEEVTLEPSSETDVNEIDQDSISKVNGWFNNMECPKPKELPLEPLTLKENASSITFTKKKNSSVASRNSETSLENKKEPAKPREIKAFKPSPYASDLLKKYMDNAQRAAPDIEDLGSRLERQLRERDELVRQKLVARQNAR